MYTSVSSREVIEQVEHIRELHRQIRATNDRAIVAHTQRERKLKDFISNLRRTETRPMANMVRDLAEACSLTTEGAYRLFGYELDGLRELDLDLNGGRTRVVESYVFHRDLMVELPLELAPADAFQRSAMLNSLVLRWQGDFPIRVLNRPVWRRPGTFYVRVGTKTVWDLTFRRERRRLSNLLITKRCSAPILARSISSSFLTGIGLADAWSPEENSNF